MSPPDDADWIRRAAGLAAESMYVTDPNPRVGCLIVRNGEIIGAGATQQAGGAHAEVMALRDMRQRHQSAEGATVYVTLEPCSHHGRTPPCVDALIEARPSRVVAAMRDPNPLVAGRGLERLREAGIEVAAPVCAREALALNPGFVARMTRKTPWTWLKTAVSLDGRAGLHNGVSQWITGPEARADGHRWRARSSVVLTGLGTILADDPQLTVRLVATQRRPVRAVVDSRFQMPEQARLIDGGPVWLFTARRDAAKQARLRERNVTVVVLPDSDGKRVDLAAMMQWMGENEVNEVHVEAGPGLSGALLQADCVDELLVYMAPVMLGDAQPMAQLPVLQTMDQARRFEFFETMPIGPDLRLRARVAERWRALLDSVQEEAGPDR